MRHAASCPLKTESAALASMWAAQGLCIFLLGRAAPCLSASRPHLQPSAMEPLIVGWGLAAWHPVLWALPLCSVDHSLATDQ